MAQVVVAQQPVVMMQPAVQPMVVMQPMMMPMQGAPQQQGMGGPKQDKEHSYLDFNQMKSLMLNTADGNYILYEQNMTCEDCARGCCLYCFTCGACDIREFKFAGPGHKLMVYKPQGCCTKWTIDMDSKGTVGFVQKASCMAGGVCFCIAKYAMCWGTDKFFEMHGTTGDKKKSERFTLRKKLFPCWCCIDIACNQLAGLTMPIADCCQSMVACCKFCSNMEYNTMDQPIYGPWGSGSETVGNISQVVRAVPKTCCTAEVEPVRVMVELPGTTTPADVALTGYLAMVYSKRIEPDFQVPKGHPCLDCGMSVHSKWESFTDMVNTNSATSDMVGEKK